MNKIYTISFGINHELTLYHTMSGKLIINT